MTAEPQLWSPWAPGTQGSFGLKEDSGSRAGADAHCRGGTGLETASSLFATLHHYFFIIQVTIIYSGRPENRVKEKLKN